MWNDLYKCEGDINTNHIYLLMSAYIYKCKAMWSDIYKHEATFMNVRLRIWCKVISAHIYVIKSCDCKTLFGNASQNAVNW